MKKQEAKVGKTDNPLYYGHYGNGTLSTPEIATVTFKNLTKKELENARVKAVANFIELYWICVLMQESKCTYTDAFLALYHNGDININ